MISPDELFALEADEGLAAYRCPDTGRPVWPVVRNVALRFVISKLFYGDREWNNWDAPASNYRRTLVGFASALARNTLVRPPRPTQILMRATGGGLVRTESGFVNRLVDDFAREYRRYVLFEDSMPPDNTVPVRRTLPYVVSTVPARIARRLKQRQRLAARHAEVAASVLRHLHPAVARVTDTHTADEMAARLALPVAGAIAAIAIDEAHWRSVFDRYAPRIFFAEEASYGHMSVPVAVAHERNVVVWEFQHGIITRGHDAYRWPAWMWQAEEFRRLAPDLLLTYGSWWNSQIELPSRCIPIGNPYRERRVADLAGADAPRKTIIVAGDGFETERFLRLAHDVATRLQGRFSVIFRPHPIERSAAAGVAVSCGLNDLVAIDGSTDLYQAMGSAYAIVGEVSTVLYEAVGLATRVFMWDSEKARFYLPSPPFEKFVDGEELATSLERTAPVSHIESGSEVWAMPWRPAFRRLLEESGVESSVPHMSRSRA